MKETPFDKMKNWEVMAGVIIYAVVMLAGIAAILYLLFRLIAWVI